MDKSIRHKCHGSTKKEKKKNERNEINFDVIHFANQKKYEAIREITD